MPLPTIGTLYCSIPGVNVAQWELVYYDDTEAEIKAVGEFGEYLSKSRASINDYYARMTEDQRRTIKVEVDWLSGREVMA